MALALYRKYRPRTFAEVIGQEHVTEPLAQALRSGRLHHAYLFSGPRGCGKTSSARILARSLNCEQGPTPEPCGQCDSCRALASDGAGSIDVIEIDAASHGGVDDARELRERAFFAPAGSRFKIYVIDEAHMVSSAGFNALLKLVEEPPDYVKFIFATTEPEKVLGTIKSRTHHYPFRLIPPGVLRPYLEQLCVAENVPVESAVFPLVVRAGGGSVRDSLSVLDQLIAGAGPDGVSYTRAVALLGVTDTALIDEMCDALAAGDGAAAYGTVDRVVEAGHDPRRFAADLLERLRDLIILRQVPDAVVKGLIDGPPDQIERMTAQAQRLGPATLSRCADIVHNGLVEMRGTTAPRLLLELICARMLLPEADDTTGALLQRLERVERRLTQPAADGSPAAAGPASAPAPSAVRPMAASVAEPSGPVGSATEDRPMAASVAEPSGPVGSATEERTAAARPDPRPPVATESPARAPVPPVAVMPDPVMPDPVMPDPVTPEPATPDPPRPGAGTPAVLDAIAEVDRSWADIVSSVGRKSKKVASWIGEAIGRDVDGKTVVLSFPQPFYARALSNQPELLLEALSEVLGGLWQIRCEVAGEQRAPISGRPPRSRPAAPQPTRSGAQPAQPTRSASAGSPAGNARGSALSDRRVAGTDWPEPARPGGSAPAGDDDWPTPASPGGTTPVAAETAADGSGTTPGGTSGGAAGQDRAGSRDRVGSRAGSRDRATTAGAPARGNRAAARASGHPTRSAVARTAGRDWAGEPPYDPDYDGPPRGAVTYEGFDPGDEPLDDVIDERTARQTSEEQAVRLLQQALGAEKIGEVDVT